MTTSESIHAIGVPSLMHVGLEGATSPALDGSRNSRMLLRTSGSVNPHSPTSPCAVSYHCV
jgi:hypothetical protein